MTAQIGRAKMRKAVTSESRKRMSEAQRRKWQDPEQREKNIKAIRDGIANKKKLSDTHPPAEPAG